MNHEIETQWKGKMQFNALVDGHTVVMDAKEKSGGENTAPIPKPFVLTALSGCTGMDVIVLLRKSSIELDDFNIKVTGELSKTQPMVYTHIHLIYEFKGNKNDELLAVKAVTDSQEKYCGVSAMLKKAAEVTWEINFNGSVVFNNKNAVLTV